MWFKDWNFLEALVLGVCTRTEQSASQQSKHRQVHAIKSKYAMPVGHEHPKQQLQQDVDIPQPKVRRKRGWQETEGQLLFNSAAVMIVGTDRAKRVPMLVSVKTATSVAEAASAILFWGICVWQPNRALLPRSSLISSYGLVTAVNRLEPGGFIGPVRKGKSPSGSWTGRESIGRGLIYQEKRAHSAPFTVKTLLMLTAPYQWRTLFLSVSPSPRRDTELILRRWNLIGRPAIPPRYFILAKEVKYSSVVKILLLGLIETSDEFVLEELELPWTEERFQSWYLLMDGV